MIFENDGRFEEEAAWRKLQMKRMQLDIRSREIVSARHIDRVECAGRPLASVRHRCCHV
jgi:hypothetical protein